MKEPTSSPSKFRRLSLLTKMLHLSSESDDPSLHESTLPVNAQGNVAVSPVDDSLREQSRRAPPENRLYLEARRHIKRRAWGHAQRALDEATRREPDSPANLDLKSVRVIRRALHRIARWPSDIDTHLELGRAYFDLDLGDEALAEFVLVQHLAPKRYEGFALATLEYLYRGEYAAAMATWRHAQELSPELPSFDDVVADLPPK